MGIFSKEREEKESIIKIDAKCPYCDGSGFTCQRYWCGEGDGVMGQIVDCDMCGGNGRPIKVHDKRSWSNKQNPAKEKDIIKQLNEQFTNKIKKEK